jgi:signal peptidase I
VADRRVGLSLPAAGSPAGGTPSGRHRAIHRSGRSRLRRVLVPVLLAIAVVLTASVTGLLPLQIMRVGSDSMEPTLRTGSLVLVDRTDQDVAVADIVVVESPLGGLLVKRAVALGGDTVGIEDGVLVVDGEAVCEPDIDPDLIDGSYFGPVTVPEGHVFLLGDHRDGSIDSREFGSVPLSAVVGQVRGRLFPVPSRLQPDRC